MPDSINVAQSSVSTSGAPALFARCSPLPDWHSGLARDLLQARFGRDCERRDLLQALIVIQHHFGTLCREAQQWLAEQCHTNRSDVLALIDFYHFLQTEDDHRINLHFSSNIVELFKGMRSLFDDLLLSCRGHAHIALTSCIGLSDQGPAALINGFPLVAIDQHRVTGIREQLQQRIPLEHWPADWFQVEDNIRLAGPLLDFKPDPADWLARLHALSPQQVLQQLQQSGLRGLGGAGFSTAAKWQACASHPAPERYVVCNADEGEPGTFKDRVLLNHNPDALLAGMLMCGYAIGAGRGILYLRGEYLFLFAAINRRLQEWRDRNWLGPQFDIEIHLGAGAYICGEETALLESIEGLRGIPKVKPPFPVQSGLFKMPTVVNNVETLVAAAWILQTGAGAFRSLGTPASPGTRLHSVSGDCERPGIYELPMGATVEQLLQHCGAQAPALVQLGGPSGRICGPTDWHRALAFEGISPGGSVMVFDESRRHLDIVRNFTAFFQHESCGFCTPCRAGTQVLKRDLETVTHDGRHDELARLANLIHTTSHCGLGQTAANPVLQWLAAQGQSS